MIVSAAASSALTYRRAIHVLETCFPGVHNGTQEGQLRGFRKGKACRSSASSRPEGLSLTRVQAQA